MTERKQNDNTDKITKLSLSVSDWSIINKPSYLDECDDTKLVLAHAMMPT